MNTKKSLNNIFLESILSNKISLLAIILIFIFLILAIFSYQIMPDNSPMANSIQLPLSKKDPGFKAKLLLLKKDRLLTLVDVSKQLGYLVGLAASFLFYKLIEYQFQIIDNQTQVFYIHYFLLLIEILVILFLIKSFEKFKHY